VAHLAFLEHDDGTATLFVNGEARALDEGLAYAAPLVTGRQRLPADTLTPHLDDPAFVELLTTLVHEGVLELAE
jgi:50S ribosomal protein L16 3-hydroxylase